MRLRADAIDPHPSPIPSTPRPVSSAGRSRWGALDRRQVQPTFLDEPALETAGFVVPDIQRARPTAGRTALNRQIQVRILGSLLVCMAFEIASLLAGSRAGYCSGFLIRRRWVRIPSGQLQLVDAPCSLVARQPSRKRPARFDSDVELCAFVVRGRSSSGRAAAC